MNCSQHITTRFTEADIAEAARKLGERVAALEAENARLKAELSARDTRHSPGPS